MILGQLSFPVSRLKGVGPRISKILAKVGVESVGDLLEYYPRAFSDRRRLLSLKEVAAEGFGTIKALVVEHRMIGRNKYKKFLKILISDGQSYGALLCFNRNFLQNVLVPGKEFYLTGKFSHSYGEIQASSFEYEEAEAEYRGRILPVYRLTEGLTQNTLRNAVEDALAKYYLEIENELPTGALKQRGLLDKRDAVRRIHFPENFDDYNKARKSLIYEDFFFQKLFLIKRKQTVKRVSKSRPAISFDYKREVESNLPFKLTGYQQEALASIESAIFTDKVFSVLLQGDVGSGKTMVALLSMLSVVEAGFQCALMVPTEVLALQHYRNFKKLAASLSLDIALFTGSLKKRERDNILSGLKSGEIDLVIGTHSLFSDDVIYRQLGYVVIDEQHRFGVEQRYQLLSKGEAVDLLLMTATPIPQSLALTLYGDLELVVMKGAISGRKPVKTWVINDEKTRLEKMHNWIKELLDNENGRAIIVYPLIENSERMERKDLMSEYAKLEKIYKSYGAAFIHSKVEPEEKDRIIEAFRSGEIKVMAATTVVEVGIDVADANVIVIEHADNYGLSTLHQLRGRVGRNNKQGYMILVAPLEELTETGRKRMEIIKNETDGFKIAEEDLILRGPGDFIGSRQSGLMAVKLADLSRDMDIMREASDDALKLIEDDSEMKKVENFNAKKSFMHRLKHFIDEYTVF